MSSCTNSSNIQSTLLSQIIRESPDGKRVSFVINSSDVGISAGVTLGSVIRFDMATDRYELSKADDPATAEVVGVVESISGTAYTVVANGLMIYPNLGSVINSYTGNCSLGDTGTDGGGGGADIFFLSDACAGKLQYLEPMISGHIVKPVMQRVKVGPTGPGQYNSIVLNYIGYEVAENATSSITDALLAGETEFLERAPKSGYLDATVTYSLKVSDYSELYDAIGTKAGPYEEDIVVKDTGSLPNLSSLLNSRVYQNNTNGTEYTTGIIVSADQTQKKITVKKDSKQLATNSSYKLRVGSLSFTVNSSQVTSFSTPKQGPTKREVIYADGTKEEVTLKPYIRTNSDVTKVTIPSSLSIQKLTCDDITTNNLPVGTKLTDFETRIRTLERRLGIV